MFWSTTAEVAKLADAVSAGPSELAPIVDEGDPIRDPRGDGDGDRDGPLCLLSQVRMLALRWLDAR